MRFLFVALTLSLAACAATADDSVDSDTSAATSGYGCSDVTQTHPEWSLAEIGQACSGAGGQCVVKVAAKHTDWAPRDLNRACTNASGNCGAVASVHADWSPAEIAKACTGTDGDCVARKAAADPSLDPTALAGACP